MPSLKEFNVKLARLRTTRKMTKTMKLVSVNKLRRAQESERRVRSFFDHVLHMIGRLDRMGDTGDNPLLKSRREPGSALILVFTSDRGLCGGFNHNLNRSVARWIHQQTDGGRKVEVSCSGRRGYAFFRNRAVIRKYYEEAASRPAYEHAFRMGHDLQVAFRRGGADEVYLAHNAPAGQANYVPAIERLLPLDRAAIATLARTASGESGDWLCEPSPAELLETLLPQMINLKVYSVLLSSATGEHSARMRAMDQATNNADSLIDRLTLQRNRARQAQITTELTEIVAGAEALK